MRPSSLGGGRILRRTLSVCPSVCPSVPLSLPSVMSFRQPLASRMYFSARIEGIRTFRHALRAAYRTAISATQILVIITIKLLLWRFVIICSIHNQCYSIGKCQNRQKMHLRGLVITAMKCHLQFGQICRLMKIFAASISPT